MTSMLQRTCLLLAAWLAAASSWSQEPEAEIYRVGPGDVLMVTIHPGGESEAIETEITVAGDGKIDIVHVGPIKVVGMGTSEIRQIIRSRLVGSGVYLQPQVSVNVQEYLSQGVNVAGAVNKQGRYYLKGPTRLLDILSEAEGIDDERAGNFVIVTRESLADPLRIDRRDLFAPDTEKARAANIRLVAGDNVNVPVKARFCISGAVKEPNCYPLEEGTSLHQAISMASGLDSETADRKNVTLRRTSAGTETRIDLDAMEAGKLQVPLIEPDDVILVGTREKTQFCVKGPVEKADCYEYEKGLTLDGAISKAGGLKLDLANVKEITIQRIVDGKLQTHVASLEDLSDKGARYKILSGDQIEVAKADCLVTVGGSVKTPNQYPLKTGMTIVDAIQVAGGVYGDAQWGNLSKVTLIRGGSQPEIVNVKAIMNGKAADIPLGCGDKIFVKRRALG